MTSIYTRYQELCEFAGEEPITTVKNLANNLQNKFGDKIRIECNRARKLGHIIYPTGSTGHFIHVAYDYAGSPEATINKAALLLRQTITKTPNTPLPNNPTLQNLYDGEMKTPDLLLHFFQVLYGGLNQSNYSPKLKRRALSSCHDAIFISQHGKVKSVKQIVLGMAVKSMTGSRKLVDMLNRYGHIVSYHTIEEIETSLGENILNMDQTCPEGTVPDQVCGLAFDNFDEIPETLSGAGTLHDTMGILYQNKDVLDKRRDVNQVGQSSSEQYTANRSLSGKRKPQVPDKTLEPYRKKPRMSTFEFDITDDGYRPDHRNNALENGSGMDDVSCFSGEKHPHVGGIQCFGLLRQYSRTECFLHE